MATPKLVWVCGSYSFAHSANRALYIHYSRLQGLWSRLQDTRHLLNWQVIQQSMLGAVGCEYFASLLEKAAAIAEPRRILMEVSQAMLHAIQQVQENMDSEILDLHELVSDNLATVADASKALLALLVPIPEYVGTSAKDVVQLVQSKSINSFHLLIRKKMEGPWWRNIQNEVNVKAGISKELAPVLRGLIDKTKQAKQLEDYSQVIEPTIDALAGLRRLESNLRAGATQHLRGHLRACVQKVGKGVLNAQEFDHVPVGLVLEFTEKLEALKDDDGIRQLQLQLQQWQKDSSSKLSAVEMRSWLQTAAE